MKNIQCIFFIVLSVVEAVCAAIFKPFPAGIIFLLALVGIAGALLVRFAYAIARWSNRWYSLWNRKNADDADDEPSTFALVTTKLSGYAALFALQIIMFL